MAPLVRTGGSRHTGLAALPHRNIHRLKIAKEFKHWVTSEVLPSIRKNGAYIRNQENMTPAEIVARGLIAAQKIIEERLDHSTQPLFILTYSH